MQSIGPALLATVGFALMFFCMYTEGEPTALPLAAIAFSGVWYAVARLRRRQRAHAADR